MFEVGSVVAGKYRILGVLGQGGMGIVYDVLHEQIDKRRALKVLHTRDGMSPDALRRFQWETKADAAIQNPHVVEVFDAGELEGGIPYVVMERLEGETLAELLDREGFLPIAQICEIVSQACVGVHAAHEAGIVHRDLKPANVFVTWREGKPFVKILDFGIAKFDRELRPDMTVTQEGTVLGTPLYMAPEQVRGRRDVDARADVYALGVILYECATGEVPYSADSAALLGVLICEGNPIPVGDLRPEAPQVFRDVVAQAMAVDRNHRYASAERLGHVLRKMVVGGVSPTPVTRDAPRVTSEENRGPKTVRAYRRVDEVLARKEVKRPGRGMGVLMAMGGTMVAIVAGVWAWVWPGGSVDERLSETMFNIDCHENPGVPAPEGSICFASRHPELARFAGSNSGVPPQTQKNQTLPGLPPSAVENRLAEKMNTTGEVETEKGLGWYESEKTDALQKAAGKRLVGGPLPKNH